MRKMHITILLMFCMVGCAKVWVKEDMQPDQSYKIVASGNGFADRGDVREEAYRRAKFLCPAGFDKKADVPDDSFKPQWSLVVMCKDASPQAHTQAP